MTTAKDELMDRLGALCERLDRVLEALERMTGTYTPSPYRHDGIQSLYGVQPGRTGQPPWQQGPDRK